MDAYGYYPADAVGDAELRALLTNSCTAEDVPHASEILKGIPVYAAQDLTETLANPATRQALLSEWAWVFGSGPGAVAISGAYADTSVIDEATTVFNDLIAQEKAQNATAADHFAAAGNNDRLWNSLQKLCMADPGLFLRYFGNPTLAAVCEAWLGPHYQMTAQINLVRPGGAAQEAHRDYHLGFQTAEQAALYPAHVHALSAIMTLQGAIAHVDMPIESGTTRLLPYSQLLGPGYVSFRQPAIRDIFDENFVQLDLKKGDALFFNPALLHAAGDNRTEFVNRMANLLQIGSPFGIVLENIDRSAMCRALYPAVLASQMPEADLLAALSASAEGYPFSTNLDTDPPIGGLAPESQKALMLRARAEGLSVEEFNAALTAQDTRRRP